MNNYLLPEYRTLVPWYNREEWEHVKKLIYESDNTMGRIQAREIIRMWKDRIRCVPNQIECTSIILDAFLLKDEPPSDYVNYVIAQSIRRFIRMCAIEDDDEDHNSITLQWIMNVIHDVDNRGSILSLEWLLSALNACFTWIKCDYWEEHCDTLEKYARPPPVICDEIKDALILYCQIASLQYLTNRSFDLIEEIAMYDATLMFHILILQEQLDIRLNLPIDAVLPRIIQYIIMNYYEIIDEQEFSDMFISTMLSDKWILTVRSDEPNFNIISELPTDFIEVWSYLVDFIYNISAMQPFLEKFLSIINTPDIENSVRKLASLWIRYLLQRLLLTKLVVQPLFFENAEKRLYGKFPIMRTLESFFHEPRHDSIFTTVLGLKEIVNRNPNEYSYLFIDCLFELCEPTPDERKLKNPEGTSSFGYDSNYP